ncbi:FtsX-like permease family protein [Pseudoalteromonas sp. J010]|uniref:ABC transporter permease n=1 Tax=Pseudoalteromonas sp. J010 TaxID=998465 RepID=UPI000F6528F1|nr:ABC transporter permease [Pseudoalteromonas sp. J010]RRS06760.1 FtsX-like permease family protein [Pseudoalteromonas sp. J010]
MIIEDLKYAFRLLSKKASFAALTTIVMASGIGLCVYLFSFFNTMVFKDLPFKDSETLLQLSASHNGLQDGSPLYYADYLEIKRNLTDLTEFSAYRVSNFNVTVREGARRLSGVFADSNIFDLTRVTPILGRSFSAAENRQGAEKVAVIGYSLWQNQFAGSPNVIDQMVRINGDSHRIIGVMPQGYLFPSNTELWVPLRESTTSDNRTEQSQVIAVTHVKANVSPEVVNHQLDVIMQRIAERYPETNKGLSAYVAAIPMASQGDTVGIIYSAHIVAILILVLASVNVGNLFLSRAIERGKETAIRVALGAPRARLIAQMVWESVIICVLGGLIGLIGISWGLNVTASVINDLFAGQPPYWWNFGIDAYTITLFSIFIVFTITVTGLLPAWKNSGEDFNQILRDGTRGAMGRKAGRFNRFLIISEIFVSLAVLIASCAMLLGMYKATQADYGAEVDNTLTAKLMLNNTSYPSEQDKVAFTNTLLSNLEAQSRLSNVVVASALPGEYAQSSPVAVQGKEYQGQGKDRYPQANYVRISTDGLEKLQVRLLEGRHFNSADKGLDKSTVIVTESFVKRYFDGQSPLGKRIRIANDDGNGAQIEWLNVIGVVEHTIHGPSFESSGKRPSVYRPVSQAPVMQLTIAAAMNTARADVTNTLRQTVSSIDPDIPVFRVESYEEMISRHTSGMMFIASVFGLFGIAAVFLATSGIYGVVANTINQKTQEIGIKRALGATEKIVTKQFLMTGVKQLLWGGIPGFVVGVLMAFAMSSMLGVSEVDLIIVAVVILFIISAAVLFATYVPTKRVVAMEPSEALRYE